MGVLADKTRHQDAAKDQNQADDEHQGHMLSFQNTFHCDILLLQAELRLRFIAVIEDILDGQTEVAREFESQR